MGNSSREVGPSTGQPVGEGRVGGMGLGGSDVDQGLQLRGPMLDLALDIGVDVLLGADWGS